MNEDFFDEEAGLPDGWHSIPSKPIIPSAVGYPPNPNKMAPYFSGTISPVMQHDSTFVGTRYGSPNIPSLPLMPLALSGLPSAGSAIQSVSTNTTIINSTAAAAGVNGNIQFNNGGAFGASSAFNWDNINSIFQITGNFDLTGSQTISVSLLVTGEIDGDVINATSGFRVGGSAATGKYLRGDGSNFVSATLSGSDVLTGLVGIPYGGTGTATPNLVAGGGIMITGTWPNQTITATGSGNVSQTALFVEYFR